MDAQNRQGTAHLLRRAGFGGTPAEIDGYAALDYEAAVDRLLNPAQVDDRAAEKALQALARNLDVDNKIVDGRAYWLGRMLLTQRPLQEKMVLFWHNHFATGIPKVKQPRLMYGQMELFRRAGLGNFQDLVLGVAKDPAMLLWLDNATNNKNHPNENWARELMELFTIGIGNYSEQDVKEVARAFSGWGLNHQTFRYEFHPRQHDSGAKTIFGQTGNWDGGDVVRMLAPRPETGKLLARKLWRWFVTEPPSEAGVAQLAQVYLDSEMNIGAMLRWLFLSADFRDPASAFSTIKNPPEFLVGLFKTLGLTDPAFVGSAAEATLLRQAARACDGMGMVLYNPPNVGGWPGGGDWLNPTTYFTRANVAEQMLLPQGNGRLVDLPRLTGSATTPAAAVDHLLATFTGGSAPPAVRQALLDYAGGALTDLKLRGLVRLIVSSPSYQMN
jgi:uncharacterized protein (DUF1800 family)